MTTQTLSEYLKKHPETTQQTATAYNPNGHTCRECGWFERRCSWLLGSRCAPGNKKCDWSPSRFIEKRNKETIG